MLHDLWIPIGRFIVAEGGVENPTLSGFLTPGSGIFALQIERDVGGFGFARLPFRFRRNCFDFTVVVMRILLSRQIDAGQSAEATFPIRVDLAIEFIVDIKSLSVKTLVQGMSRIIVLYSPSAGFPPRVAAKGATPELRVFRPPPFSSIRGGMASE